MFLNGKVMKRKSLFNYSVVCREEGQDLLRHCFAFIFLKISNSVFLCWLLSLL